MTVWVCHCHKKPVIPAQAGISVECGMTVWNCFSLAQDIILRMQQKGFTVWDCDLPLNFFGRRILFNHLR